ncbi:MAG: amidohydrolase family protein, partial [Gemmatimonadetes bacterium]|nr:amidohydrolase family protein [Gemmatimonadota bacterium]
ALATYTVNPAFAAFEEDIKGTLTPGKLADITILSRDIMTIPEAEIPNVDVLYTVIDGEVRYEYEAGD